MIIKLFSVGILVGIVYILGVFFVPEFADTYGNTSLNAKIRHYKDMSLEFASGSDNSASLVDKITTTSQSYIDETKKTYENITTTLSGKAQDVKTAADSVERAYDAINAAKADLNKVINSASGTSSGKTNTQQ